MYLSTVPATLSVDVPKTIGVIWLITREGGIGPWVLETVIYEGVNLGGGRLV
jgi:hypothetical protein